VIFALVALITMLGLIAWLHNTRYPHIDDVLMELDREDAKRAQKNVANQP